MDIMKEIDISEIDHWLYTSGAYIQMSEIVDVLYNAGFDLTRKHFHRPDIMILVYDGHGTWTPIIRRK